MTALKPIENRRVRGVAAERYPLNKKCAHPECNEPVADPHHIFPRSQIGNDSWFVEIQTDVVTDSVDENGPFQGIEATKIQVIPHVTGLCRAHHDDVEEHRSWIKLEDGVFVWYSRMDPGGELGDETVWLDLGPLNPQPGSVEGRPKRKKFRGERRRNRTTISIKVPKDSEEDGAGLFMDLVEQIEAKRVNDEEARPIYYTLMDALAYTLANADSTDF